MRKIESMFFPVMLALVVFVGHVTDKITGQDLSGIAVSVANSKVKPAMTDSLGRFRLKLAPGTYTVHMESNDVPPQEFTVRILATGQSASRDFKVCSLTLDYHC